MVIIGFEVTSSWKRSNYVVAVGYGFTAITLIPMTKIHNSPGERQV